MPIKRSALHDDEVVVVEVRQHWSVVLGPVASATIVVAAVSALGVFLAPLPMWTLWVAVAVVCLPVLRGAVMLLRWSRHTVTLTSDRIMVRRGAFSNDQGQLRLDRVADVGFRQSILDRMLGRGTVTVELDEGDVAVFEMVRRPRAFAHVVTAELLLRSGGSATAHAELADSVAELTSVRPRALVAPVALYDQDRQAPDLDGALNGLPLHVRRALEALLDEFERGEISASTYERERFELLRAFGVDPGSSR